MPEHDDIAPQLPQPQPADPAMRPGISRWRMFSPANATAFEFFYHTVGLLAGCFVLLGAAVALDVLAAYAAASGLILRPLAWVARFLSYGVVTVDLVLFSVLVLAESWHFFRGTVRKLDP
jgi:hypothetical protein